MHFDDCKADRVHNGRFSLLHPSLAVLADVLVGLSILRFHCMCEMFIFPK